MSCRCNPNGMCICGRGVARTQIQGMIAQGGCPYGGCGQCPYCMRKQAQYRRKCMMWFMLLIIVLCIAYYMYNKQQQGGSTGQEVQFYYF